MSSETYDCSNCGQCEECTACPITLDRLPIGAIGVITELSDKMPGKKKFTDVGLVEGSLVRMDGHAPFGGLLRINVMDTCLALHTDDAKFIKVSVTEAP